jgi:hypothetical protein
VPRVRPNARPWMAGLGHPSSGRCAKDGNDDAMVAIESSSRENARRRTASFELAGMT